MDDKSKYVIITVVLATLIGAGCYAFGVSQQSNDDETDLTGYWYQVGYYIYDDGIYGSVDQSSMSLNYGINIIGCEKGIFTGIYQNGEITGSYSDDTIVFTGVYDDYTTWFYGTISGNMIYASCTEYGDNMKGGYLVYSQDINAVPSNPSVTDIMGDWEVVSAYALIEGNIVQISGDSLAITEQMGSVFYGNMEQMKDSQIENTDITGAFTNIDNDGYRIGYMLDEYGVNWTVLMKDGQIVLRTNILDTMETEEYLLGSVERSYTRDGDSSSLNVEADLAGTSWRWESSMVAYDNTVSDIYIDYIINFDTQEGSILSGTMDYRGYSHEMTAYLYGSSPVTICISGKYSEMDIYGIGTIIDGKIYFNEWSDDGKELTSTVFTQVTDEPIEPDTLVGHWSCLSSIGIDIDDQIYYSTTGYNMEELYDLTILNAEDGMFNGYFEDVKIAGTYEGGVLRFTVTTDEGLSLFFTGRFTADNVFLSEELYYSENGIIQVWRSIYSTSYMLSGLSSVEDDGIASDWTSPDGYSFQYIDGTSDDLLGQNITIKKMGPFVTGTMEQEVDGVLVDKKFIGIYHISANNISSRAIIMDETGLVYEVELLDDVLYLSTTTVTDSEYTGERVAADRIYTLDGSSPIIPGSLDLEGTVWTSTYSICMDKDGNVGTYGNMTISIEDQYLNVFSGTVVINGESYGLVGYMIFDSDIDEPNLVISYCDNVMFESKTAVIDSEGVMHLTGYNDGSDSSKAFKVDLSQ